MLVTGLLGGATAVASAGTTAAAAAAPTVAGVWGTVRDLPGLTALGKVTDAGTGALSCTAVGYCTVAGSYSTAKSNGLFVATESHGSWGAPAALGGAAAPSASGYLGAELSGLSCSSPGNCTAAGTYFASGEGVEVFVVTEQGGKWNAAVAAPGLLALNVGNNASVGGLSCPSAGNCVVIGDYTDGAGFFQPFTLAETAGVWQDAAELPGVAALGDAGGAFLSAVSCASAGNCAVGGGYYPDASETVQSAFVASEAGGLWGDAVTVPGTSGYKGGTAVNAVACASAGHCAAAGTFHTSTAQGAPGGAFALTTTGGTWGSAVTVPGLNEIDLLACPASGDCAAGGTIVVGKNVVGNTKAAVATETAGKWGKGTQVPGLASIPNAEDSRVAALWCKSPGDCDAAGTYEIPRVTPDGGSEAFTTDQVNGAWSAQRPIPGLNALNTDFGADVTGLSCTGLATCTAAGFYFAKTASGPAQVPFIASETLDYVTTTTLTLSAVKLTYGHEQSGRFSVVVTARVGTPAGKVTVKAGSAVLCVVALKAGKGTCSLKAKQLKAGTHHLTASYPGAAGFTGSVTAAKTLTVVK